MLTRQLSEIILLFVQHLTDMVSDHNKASYSTHIIGTAKYLLADLTAYEVLYFFYEFADFIHMFSSVYKKLETADIDIVQAVKYVKKLRMDIQDFKSDELQNQKYLVSFLSSIQLPENTQYSKF